jgi:predicted transglutaminase-like cysteine proteinase
MSRETPTKSTIRRGRDFWVILACLGLMLSVSWFFNPVRASGHSASRTAFSGANHVSLASMIEDRTHAEPAAPQPGGTGQPTLLFGVDTEPVADGELPERWRRVKADIARDLETVARCHANGSCTAPAPALIAIIAEGVGHRGRARIGMINRAVNLAITPMSDQAQWGVPDRWSAPLETLQSSRGDCEDYAIVKYAALLGAGISESDLKIVIFKNLLPREDHAALAVHVDGQWLILDNRTLTLVSDTDVIQAIPEYVLDENGVSRFVRTRLPTPGRHS